MSKTSYIYFIFVVLDIGQKYVKNYYKENMRDVYGITLWRSNIVSEEADVTTLYELHINPAVFFICGGKCQKLSSIFGEMSLSVWPNIIVFKITFVL
jgi:hypothetical protein